MAPMVDTVYWLPIGEPVVQAGWLGPLQRSGPAGHHCV